MSIQLAFLIGVLCGLWGGYMINLLRRALRDVVDASEDLHEKT